MSCNIILSLFSAQRDARGILTWCRGVCWDAHSCSTNLWSIHELSCTMSPALFLAWPRWATDKTWIRQRVGRFLGVLFLVFLHLWCFCCFGEMCTKSGTDWNWSESQAESGCFVSAGISRMSCMFETHHKKASTLAHCNNGSNSNLTLLSERRVCCLWVHCRAKAFKLCPARTMT